MSLETPQKFTVGTESVCLQEAADSLIASFSVVKKKIEFAKNKGEVGKNWLEKARAALWRAARTAAIVGLLGALPNDPARRFEVQQVESGEFYHSDKETTAILNFLAGKRDFSPEERLKMLKDSFSFWPDQVGVNLSFPENYDSMTIGEFKILADSLAKTHPAEFGFIADFTEEEWLYRTAAPALPKFDQHLYESLWSIEQEAGNPKIRWNYEWNKKSNEGRHRSHFIPETNTMFLANDSDYRKELIEHFVAEASHGVQTKSLPKMLRHIGTQAPDFFRIAVEAIVSEKGFSEVHADTIYNKKGSTEYEAHKEIQPRLNSKLPPKFRSR
ncbi:MAG: hypothetical protein M3M85_00935 [bacterium]|nr:hypothetical protein [bacterium]